MITTTTAPIYSTTSLSELEKIICFHGYHYAKIWFVQKGKKGYGCKLT